MRRLMLLRHAKTETNAPSGKDRDRRLDPRGHTDAAMMGKWLAQNRYLPDMVLVSTAVRAEQTWDIVWGEIADASPQTTVDHLPELYGADPAELLSAIRDTAVSDPRLLLVVGHNPGLHELALGLTAGGDPAASKALADNLPTSGLALIDFAIDDWSEVAFRRGKLALFASPKLLKTPPGAAR